MTLEEFLVFSLLSALLIAIGIWGLILLPPPLPLNYEMTCTNMLETCKFNDKADFISDLVVAVIVGVGALAFAVSWLLRGVRAVLGFVGRGSGRSTETELSLSSTLRGRA
jgi:hypothetical protein